MTKILSLLKNMKGAKTALTVIMILAGMFAGYKGGKNAVEGGADTVIVVVTDTFELITTEVVNAPAVIESVHVMVPYNQLIRDTLVTTVTESVMVYTEIATLDTTLNEGHLNVAYTPRFKWFDLKWEPNPVAVTYDSMIHTYKVDMGDTKALTVIGGAGYSFGDKAYIGVGVKGAGYQITYEQAADELRFGLWKNLYSF